MASIQHRNGTYKITVSLGRDQSGKQIRETTTYIPQSNTPKAIEREVQDFARDFEKRVKNGDYLDGEKTSLAEFYLVWDREWAPENLQQRTRESYEELIERRFIPTLGQLKMSKIRPPHIQRIITEMIADGYSPRTIKRNFVAFNSVMKYAYKQNVIQEDPCLRCSLPKDKKEIGIHCFDLEQSKRFLRILDEGYQTTHKAHSRVLASTGEKYTVPEYTETRKIPLQLQVYFLLAIIGGFRRGEMIALRWCDVDFEKNVISITHAVSRIRSGEQIEKDPKTVAGYRDVMCPQICFDKLRRWRNEQSQIAISLGSRWKGKRGKDFDQNYIFIQSDGSMMNLTTPYTKFKEIISHVKDENEDLYFPQITLHELRHSSATLLFAMGLDPVTISKRLGHSRTSITMDVYAHALKSQDEKASQALEGLFKDCVQI